MGAVTGDVTEAADSCCPLNGKSVIQTMKQAAGFAAVDNINLRSEILPWMCYCAGLPSVSFAIEHGDKLICQCNTNGTLRVLLLKCLQSIRGFNLVIPT